MQLRTQSSQYNSLWEATRILGLPNQTVDVVVDYHTTFTIIKGNGMDILNELVIMFDPMLRHVS